MAVYQNVVKSKQYLFVVVFAWADRGERMRAFCVDAVLRFLSA